MESDFEKGAETSDGRNLVPSSSEEETSITETGQVDNPTSTSEEDVTRSDESLDRPDSLNLPLPLQYYEEHGISFDDVTSIEARNTDDISRPSASFHSGGTYTKTGDMIEFVADNLQEKIKSSRASSSLGSRTSSYNSISSFTSTSVATSSGISRSPSSILQHSPDDIPPIDPLAIIEIEKQSKLVADRLDLLMGNLRSNLFKMSSITSDCAQTYKQSVDKTCDSVDSAIKSMYTLMARCEELSKSVMPVYELANQIKEIKRLLDVFELTMDKRT